MNQLHSLSVTLSITGGEAGRLRVAPGTLLVLRAMVPSSAEVEQFLADKLEAPGQWGVLRVLPGEPGWRSLPLGAVRALALALQDLGLPGPRPALVGIPDTSDVSTSVELCGVLDEQPFGLSLWLMASGYRGADAPAFARLCTLLVGLAGLPEEEYRGLLLAG